MYINQLSPKELLLLYLQDRMINHAVNQFKYIYSLHAEEALLMGDHKIKTLILHHLKEYHDDEHTMESRGFNAIVSELKSMIANLKNIHESQVEL